MEEKRNVRPPCLLARNSRCQAKSVSVEECNKCSWNPIYLEEIRKELKENGLKQNRKGLYGIVMPKEKRK